MYPKKKKDLRYSNELNETVNIVVRLGSCISRSENDCSVITAVHLPILLSLETANKFFRQNFSNRVIEILENGIKRGCL